jgi:hypothetical protein
MPSSLASPAAPRYTGDDVAPAVERCVTCGAPAGTAYCPQCGERRAADRPHTLRALAEELWDAFSPVDGRVARTLWSLVRRPGELTAAYVRGVRLPFVPPLRLFLLVNVVYFVVSSAIDVHAFDTPLAIHIANTRHASRAERMVIHRLAADPARETYAAYAQRFDAQTTTQAKSLVLVMVPAFALAAAALARRRRRPALHHLAFALHTYAALLLVAIAAQATFVVAARWLVRHHLAWLRAHPHALAVARSFDATVSLAIMAVFGAWLWLALRRAYGDSRLVATLKVPVLLYAVAQILFLYRDALFFTTFWAT